MRQFIRDFVEICARHIDVMEPIYEFGSYQCEGQEDIANMRTLFPGQQFVGTDMREGPGVDQVMDVEMIELRNEKVGLALCLETLEHVQHPFSAMSEIERVLKPNGVFILTTVFAFPIHEYPADYWRFTPECIVMLLDRFGTKFIYAIGHEDNPDTIAAIAAKGTFEIPDHLSAELDDWQQRNSRLITGE